MSNAIIIYCDGGIANRINCLANGLVIAKMLQRPHQVYWPLNRYCQADLSDIFHTELNTYNAGKQMLKNIKSCLIVADENFISAPKEFWINPGKPNGLKDVEGAIMNASANADLVLVFYPIPLYEKFNDFRSELINIFNPKQEIINLFQQVLLQLNLPKRYWGLHMRGTDAKKNNKYYESFKLLTKLLPGKYYLASDDRELMKYFSDRPNIIMRENIALPSKLELDGEWTAKQLDENGDILPYNIHRNGASIRDAIVDLLILSKSNLIPTSTSTYLELAGNLSGEKFSILPRIFLLKHALKMFTQRFRGGFKSFF